MSEIISGGYKAVADHLRKEGPALLFRWMALVYLKTHLRDTTLRWHLDPRKGNYVIGDIYDWDTLHHIHCIVRTAINGVQLGHGAMGSLALFPVHGLPGEHDYDYGDMYAARTFFLRSGDLALLAVLNDAGAAFSAMRSVLPRLKGPLITPQLLELLAHFAFVNLHLKERPSFATMPTGTGFEIVADVPEAFELDIGAPPSVGEMTAKLASPFIRGDTPEEHAQIVAEFQRGERTFLFDGSGAFVDYRHRSLTPVQK